MDNVDLVLKIVVPVLAGVFTIVKYLVNDIKSDIRDCKKTAARAHNRLDIHIENHSN